MLYGILDYQGFGLSLETTVQDERPLHIISIGISEQIMSNGFNTLLVMMQYDITQQLVKKLCHLIIVSYGGLVI